MLVTARVSDAANIGSEAQLFAGFGGGFAAAAASDAGELVLLHSGSGSGKLTRSMMQSPGPSKAFARFMLLSAGPQRCKESPTILKMYGMGGGAMTLP